jgi:ADP-ribose pyrophosphatase YjhB (NUDIX family)
MTIPPADPTPSSEVWLDWAQRLAALSQSGLHYAVSEFDVERYEQVRAIAAEMLATAADSGVDQVMPLLAVDDGYATPKIDMRAVVLHDEHLLYVRERSDGRWSLPGGFADVGEGPAAAVEREVREESGYEVRADRLLAVFDRRRHGHPPDLHHIWKLYVACELVGGEATGSVETTDVRFFPREEVPELSTIRVTEGQIARALALADDPGAAPHLD